MQKIKVLTALTAGSLLLTASINVLANDYNPTPYVGVQAGYGNTNWDNLPVYDIKEKNDGLAARFFAGYDFLPNVAMETGYTYFSPTEIKLNGKQVAKVDTYAFDVLAKFKTRFDNGVGAYIKAGPGYLHSDSGDDYVDNVGHFDLVYGGGLDYALAPNLLADISWTRFSGYGKLNDNYQPNADLYALGIVYKFNANL